MTASLKINPLALEDIAAPTLQSFELSQNNSVDISQGDGSFYFDITVSEDLVGLTMNMRFGKSLRNYSGDQSFRVGSLEYTPNSNFSWEDLEVKIEPFSETELGTYVIFTLGMR